MSKKPTPTGTTTTTMPSKVSNKPMPPASGVGPATIPKAGDQIGVPGFLQQVGKKNYTQQYKATVNFLHNNPDQIQALIKAVAPKYDAASGKRVSVIDTIAGAQNPDRVLATLLKSNPAFRKDARGGSSGWAGLFGYASGATKFNSKKAESALHSSIQDLMKKGYSHDDAYRALEQELLQKGKLNTKDAQALWQKWMKPPMSPAQELQTIIKNSVDPAEQQKLQYFGDTANQLEQYNALKGKARTAAFPGGKPSTSGIDSALGVSGHYGNWTPEQIRAATAQAAAKSVPDEFKAMLKKIQDYATGQYDVTKTLQSVGGKPDMSWENDPLLKKLVGSSQIKIGPSTASSSGIDPAVAAVP